MNNILKSLLFIIAFVSYGIYQFTKDNEKMAIVDEQHQNLNEANFESDTIVEIQELKFPGKGNYQLFKTGFGGLNYFAFAKDSLGHFMHAYIQEGDVLYSENNYIIVHRNENISHWLKQEPHWVSREYSINNPEVFLPILMGAFVMILTVLFNIAKKKKNKGNHHKDKTEPKFPFKIGPTILFIALWNILFYLGYQEKGNDSFPNLYSSIALLLLLMSSLSILIIPKFKDFIAKENAPNSSIRNTAILLVTISSLMLIASLIIPTIK